MHIKICIFFNENMCEGFAQIISVYDFVIAFSDLQIKFTLNPYRLTIKLSKNRTIREK